LISLLRATSIATTQPFSVGSIINYAYEIKQHVAFSIVPLETQQSFCQQTNLIQFAVFISCRLWAVRDVMFTYRWHHRWQRSLLSILMMQTVKAQRTVAK